MSSSQCMTGTDELAIAYRKQKDRLTERILAVRLFVIKKQSVEQISEALDVSRQSVYNWIEQYQKYGIEGLKDLPPYRKCDLEIDNQRWLATEQKRIQYGAQ